ncbi:MAG: IclR family transcriptional regulator [Spirochaetia bacterium]
MKTTDYTIPILSRTLATLDAISEHPDGMTFPELQNYLDIPKTSLFRILFTLEKEGLLEKNDEHYSLGYKMIHYGMTTLSRRTIRKQAEPFLRELMEATEETTHLAVLSGKRSMIVEVCDSTKHIKMSSPVGTLIPIYCSAHGKVFLSYGIKEPLKTFLKGESLIKRTENTLSSIEDLEHEVIRIRERGYALDDREYYDDVRCIAAPVWGKEDKVIGAIGLTATTMTFTEERIPEMAEKVLHAAGKLSRRMGSLN